MADTEASRAAGIEARPKAGLVPHGRWNGEDIEARIARLEACGREDLLSAWNDAFGVPPPRNSSRSFLIKAVGHHLQARTFGDIRPATRKTLVTIARQIQAGGQIPTLPAPKRQLKPGSRLVRSWRGRTHEIQVTASGAFEWQGETYPSLSTIATAITGTRRNGPAFFGLRDAGRAP